MNQSQATMFDTGAEPSHRDLQTVLDYFGGLKPPIPRRRLELFAKRHLGFWDRRTLARFQEAMGDIERGTLTPVAALGRAFWDRGD